MFIQFQRAKKSRKFYKGEKPTPEKVEFLQTDSRIENGNVERFDNDDSKLTLQDFCTFYTNLIIHAFLLITVFFVYFQWRHMRKRHFLLPSHHYHYLFYLERLLFRRMSQISLQRLDHRYRRRIHHFLFLSHKFWRILCY